MRHEKSHCQATLRGEEKQGTGVSYLFQRFANATFFLWGMYGLDMKEMYGKQAEKEIQ